MVREFGKLPSADQAFIADQQWRIDLFIAILRRLPVKHELRQRAMQAGHLPTQGSKACPRHGGSRFKVQPQRGSEIGMILRFEIEAARFAPAGKLDVCALIRANRSEEHTV